MTNTDLTKLLEKLAQEYRPTMDLDVLHSWAQDVHPALLKAFETIRTLRATHTKI